MPTDRRGGAGSAYHWPSIKATVTREISEDDPERGPRVTAQLDRIGKKYTGDDGRYGLRDPGRDERRMLFELRNRHDRHLRPALS